MKRWIWAAYVFCAISCLAIAVCYLNTDWAVDFYAIIGGVLYLLLAIYGILVDKIAFRVVEILYRVSGQVEMLYCADLLFMQRPQRVVPIDLITPVGCHPGFRLPVDVSPFRVVSPTVEFWIARYWRACAWASWLARSLIWSDGTPVGQQLHAPAGRAGWLEFSSVKYRCRKHALSTGIRRYIIVIPPIGFSAVTSARHSNTAQLPLLPVIRTDANSLNSPLKKSLYRRGRVIVAEDKARDRRESLDSGRERNAAVRSQGPDVTRMDFFNGLLRVEPTEISVDAPTT